MTDATAPVVIAPDVCWPQRARRAAAELQAALGPAALRIEHIGSTAIAAMPAKDVLDLQVSVADLAVTDTFTYSLESLGYVPNPHVMYDHIPTASWTTRCDGPSAFSAGERPAWMR